ncbi:MAG: hypothetical protein A2W61_07130 [Deltaproteobacteria bacterium RIFCSPLOWO2_01_44_7]|nr:MAG: hypothetical protein A2712_08185 [Deltaproteobacteria bacterium RIFCSPHIGHO2_01_FULL_43_49]OGQ14684.1 MAG: hypothetical protein A3D22_08815 [Deltaproteobacteria bacterium RIFCSPHIGHO2_02_FULL_44_53]OGQ28070.1 MAG: hypothetical protein A3D98_07525 [Deltaproteobacteria bacterium RIFCSPHIGHO2_12_FULL_44_21]OGQ31282.1 MAG: hypothetical protein A2979_07575 [Deltaproteobacteria bacterium RIFCSPLOWO2_01_FULL_45_74]OGQ41515.1 MAG: hypothetical protein A2W61_07130 [Deltaproteobacteria bacterium 
MNSLKNKTVVLGVGGGIAAYKSCELVRLLVQEEADVHVVLTGAAKEFVTPLTLQTLSHNPVHTDLFDLTQEQKIGHIALADKANIVVIAPTTADLIAKAAHGLANDLLTNILLATRAPVLFCPSMNVHMWEHKATQWNIGRLKELGYKVLEPDSGELACGYEGKGRLCEPSTIVSEIVKIW